MTVLTRWDPFRATATLQDRMNRLLRESFNPEGPEEALTTTRARPTGGHLRRRAQDYAED